MLSSGTVSPSPHLLLESSPEPSLREDFEGSAELSLLGAFFICKMPNLAANGNSQQKRMVSSGWDIYEHFLSKRCEAGNLSVLPESSPAAVRQLNAKFQLGFCPWCFATHVPSPCLRQPLFVGHTQCHQPLPGPGVQPGLHPSPDVQGGPIDGKQLAGYPRGLLSCGVGLTRAVPVPCVFGKFSLRTRWFSPAKPAKNLPREFLFPGTENQLGAGC